MEYVHSMQESKNHTQDFGYKKITQNLVIKALMPTWLASRTLNNVTNEFKYTERLSVL